MSKNKIKKVSKKHTSRQANITIKAIPVIPEFAIPRKSYKTECMLNKDQLIKHNKSVGVCRVAYNLFIDVNKARYIQQCKGKIIRKELAIQYLFNNFSNNTNSQSALYFCLFLLLDKYRLSYMDANEFSLWFNNYYAKAHLWIKEANSKAVRNAIDNANKAYKKHMSKQGGKPVYKHKRKNPCNYYYVRNSASHIIDVERHRIKIPGLGWVQLKEFGYIPESDKQHYIDDNKNNPKIDIHITSGNISMKAGRSFVSATTDEVITVQPRRTGNIGLGLDLGVETHTTLSNGHKIERKLYEKIQDRRYKEEKILARKYRYAMNKGRPLKKGEKIPKGKFTPSKSFNKQSEKVASIYLTESFQREDFINKAVNEVINICNGDNQTKQIYSFITLEHLDIKQMMSNKHMSQSISEQGWHMFVTKLKFKASLQGIEIRRADKWFASSKLCSVCGSYKKDLKLKDRIYSCPHCKVVIDRDYNASLNLMKLQVYEIAA